MEWLKTLHVTCVVLSFSGFFIRGLWMLTAPDKLQNKWVKTVPHIVDAVLLSSALLMLFQLQLSIFENNWLIAKISALAIYILLGMLALKPGRPKLIRGIAWVSGMIIFIYIVSVALTKSVAGFFYYWF